MYIDKGLRDANRFKTTLVNRSIYAHSAFQIPPKRGQKLFSNGLVLVLVRHGRVPAISGPRLTLIRLLPLAFSRPPHSGQATTSPFSATCHTHLERSFLRAIFNSLAIENIRSSLCRFTPRQVSIFLGAASYLAGIGKRISLASC